MHHWLCVCYVWGTEENTLQTIIKCLVRINHSLHDAMICSNQCTAKKDTSSICLDILHQFLSEKVFPGMYELDMHDNCAQPLQFTTSYWVSVTGRSVWTETTQERSVKRASPSRHRHISLAGGYMGYNHWVCIIRGPLYLYIPWIQGLTHLKTCDDYDKSL